MAATLKEDEKVKLGKLKSILTVVARNIVGEKKIKGVFVKDYRRIKFTLRKGVLALSLSWHWGEIIFTIDVHTKFSPSIGYLE